MLNTVTPIQCTQWSQIRVFDFILDLNKIQQITTHSQWSQSWFSLGNACYYSVDKQQAFHRMCRNAAVTNHKSVFLLFCFHDSSELSVTVIQAGQPWLEFPAKSRDFPVPQNVWTGSETYPLPYAMHTGDCFSVHKRARRALRRAWNKAHSST